MGAGAGAGFRASFGTISITISLIDRLTSRLTRMSSTISSTNQRIANSFRAVGTVMTAVSMMAMQQMQSMVESARPLIESISRLNSVMVTSETTVKEATKSTNEWLSIIMDIGEKTGAAAQDISNALWQIASAGVKTRDNMIAVARTAARLSQQFKVDTREAVDTLIMSMRGFGVEMEKVSNVSGIFNQAISNSTLTLHDLQKTMQYVAPVAGAVNMKIQDVTAAIAAMAQAGVRGSKAGTSLRTAITRMAAPTAAAREWMQKLNISFFEVPEAAKEVRSAWSDMHDQLDSLQKEYKETERRVKELQEAEEEYSMEAQKISHRIEAIRLKAAKQDRDLTKEEIKRIDELKEERDILQWQAEERSIREQELRDQMESNQKAQKKAKDRAKELWEQYQNMKGEMKSIVDIAGMLSDKTEQLTPKQMMTFIKELIGRRGLTGFLALMNQTGEGIEANAAQQAKYAEALSSTGGFLGEMQEKLQGTMTQQVDLGEKTRIGTKMWEGYKTTGQGMIDIQNQMNREMAASAKEVANHRKEVLEAIKATTDMRIQMEKLSMEFMKFSDMFPIGGIKGFMVTMVGMATVVPIVYSLSAAFWALSTSGSIAVSSLAGIAAIGIVGILASLATAMAAVTVESDKMGVALSALAGTFTVVTAMVTGFTTQLSSAGIYGIIVTLIPLIIRFHDNLKILIPLLGALGVSVGVVVAGLWGLSTVPVVAAITAIIMAVTALIKYLTGHSLIDSLKIITDALKFMGKAFMKVFNVIKNVVLSIVDWLTENWKKILIGILFPPAAIAMLINQLFPGLVDDIIDALKSLPGRVISLAKEIPKAIWEGIKSMGGWLMDKLGDFASDIIDKLNPMNWDWPFSPPSGVGVKMIEEIGKGIEKTKPKTAEIASRAGNTVKNNIVQGAAPRGMRNVGGTLRGAPGGGGTTVNINVKTGNIEKEADEDRLSKKIARETKKGVVRRGG